MAPSLDFSSSLIWPIGAVAIVFFAMGVLALVQPRAIGRFFQVRYDSVDGRNEVRAVYGGFSVAIAVVLLLSLFEPALRRGVLVCVASALAGMAGGRVIGALVERPGFWPWLFCGFESAGAALLFLAAR